MTRILQWQARVAARPTHRDDDGQPGSPEPAADPAALHPRHGHWHHSSMDLEHGLDVVELDLDTLPAALWEPPA